MKKILALFLFLILILAPAADAAIGSQGLIVDHGAKEIILRKGEKKWLFVQDGFSKMPLFKGLSFYSDNTIVATVGLHSGVLRGNTTGTANLTVVNRSGDCGYVKIKVISSKKIGSPWLLFLLIAIGLSAILILGKKKL